MEACWCVWTRPRWNSCPRLWTQTAGRPLTRRREENNDLHSQTNTVAHLHKKRCRWGRSGDKVEVKDRIHPVHKIWSTSFPFSFFNDVSCKVKRKKSRLFFHSGLSLLLISKKKQQKTHRCHRIFCPLFTVCEKTQLDIYSYLMRPNCNDDDRRLGLPDPAVAHSTGCQGGFSDPMSLLEALNSCTLSWKVQSSSATDVPAFQRN